MAGRQAGPTLTFTKPGPLIGQTGDLELIVDAHGAAARDAGRRARAGRHADPAFRLPGDDATKLTQQADGKLRLTRPIGKRALPALKPGKARFIATSSRKVLFGMREVSSEASRDVEVQADPAAGGGRLDAPLRQPRRLGDGRLPRARRPTSNRASASATSAIAATRRRRPASPAPMPSLKVGFFALLHDQDLNAPVAVFARDAAGNEATGVGRGQGLPEGRSASSRIDVDDAFLGKVVPPILANTPDAEGRRPVATCSSRT